MFDRMLTGLVRVGELSVTFPDGRTVRYGHGGGPVAGVAIRTVDRVRALCLRPELALGEGYMDGSLTVSGDDLEGLIRLLLRNRGARSDAMPAWSKAVGSARFRLAGLMATGRQASRANVAHHYDLSNDLYRLFLDEDMQYSCAYFTDPDVSLEEAQAAKKAHIAAKLRLEPGMAVLDIGCGWGGLAITLARDYGVRVTGVTLSENQLALGRARVREAGLEDRIDLRMQDYRDVTDRFDRVVSVGMLEHVGLAAFEIYFAKIAEVLAPGGVALVHTIGHTSEPGPKSEWLARYIFPGGYIPSLSELSPPLEASGLWTTDVEVLRLHYAMTLRHWLARFEANIVRVRQMFDERFVRMWRFYLVICIVAFEEQRQGVFQIQMSRTIDAIPLTRDYIAEAERGRIMQRAAE